MKGKIAAQILGICLLLVFLPLGSVLATSSNAQLQQYVSDLQNDSHNFKLREKIIKLVLNMETKPSTPDEYVIWKTKGFADVEKAHSAADFDHAYEAFLKASIKAPWKAEIYYNMGLVLEKAGKPGKASSNYKLYLIAKPGAKDRVEVLAKIKKLNSAFKREEKENTEMAAKYGGRHTDLSFGFKDMYIYGGISLDMPVGQGGSNRTIGMKVLTNGTFENKLGIFDVTEPVNALSVEYDLNGRGTQYVNIHIGSVNDNLILVMKDVGAGDIDILLSPSGSSFPNAHTSLKELLKERAQQAVSAGYEVSMGNQRFYVFAQGGFGAAYLLFYPESVSSALENDIEQDLNPKFIVPWGNYQDKGGAEGNLKAGNKTFIGNINGEQYYFDPSLRRIVDASGNIVH